MKLTSHSKNIIFIYTGDAISRVLGLLAISYLARVLGPADFGTISIGLAALAYALVLGNSGLKLLGTRTVAGEKERVEFLTANILAARLLLSTLAFVLGLGIVYCFMEKSQVFQVILVYLLGVLPSALLLEWFFQGQRKLGIIAGGKILGMFCYLLLILLFVKSSVDIVWVAWAWILGIAVNCIFLWILFKKRKYTVSFKRKNLKIGSILLQALPLGVATIIAQVTTQFPPIYLGLVSTKSQAGLFSAAFKVIVFLLILDRTFYAVFFPSISRCFTQFPDQLKENVNHVLKLTTVTALMIALYAVFSGKTIIHWIYGPSFLEAVPVFQVLLGYFVLNLINSVFTFTLIGMEKEKVYFRALFWGMVSFLITLLLLTKSLGTSGVACGLIVYQLTALVIMALTLIRQVRIHYFRSLILPFSGALSVLLLLFIFNQVTFLIKVIIITIVGFPLISWLGGIGKQELDFLKRKLI